MHAPSTTTGQGLTRKLAEFAASFSLPLAPAVAVDNAKKVILDCLGVSVLATTQEIGERTLAFARAQAAPGSCTIWGTCETASTRDAALLNGMLAHGLDYDDRNHSSTYTLAVALALLEAQDSNGQKLLEAFIVGREVRNSLDALFAQRGSGIGPGARGWHSNGVLGPIASACTAAKALGLSAGETTTAIGLAAGSCGALTRDGGTMAKPFRAGQAASTGLTCAYLAQCGFTADETILEARYGLLDALGAGAEELTALGEKLGSKFQLSERVKIKEYACCTASQSGLEAMLRLVRRKRIDPEEVCSVETDLKPYPLVRQLPARGFEGRFSLPFCLAVALIHGRVAADDFRDENVADPRVQALMRRTTHVAKASELVVGMKDGTRLVEPLEPPANLQDWSDIEQKFRACCLGVLDEDSVAALVQMVRHLDDLASVRGLTHKLRQNKQRS
jgi:2-methylcitrate dehydratase PrpD